MEEKELTTEEILEAASPETIEDIEELIKKQVSGAAPPMNRQQRRALRKKMGKQARAGMASAQDEIMEAAKTINYIDLIQKLRKLNEEKENENYEDAEN